MRRFKASLEIAGLGAALGGIFGGYSGLLFSFDNLTSFIGFLVGGISGFLLCFGTSLLFVLLMKGRIWYWGFLYGTILGGAAGVTSNFLTFLALTLYTEGIPIKDVNWTGLPGLWIGIITSIILLSNYHAHLE